MPKIFPGDRDIISFKLPTSREIDLNSNQATKGVPTTTASLWAPKVRETSTAGMGAAQVKTFSVEIEKPHIEG